MQGRCLICSGYQSLTWCEPYVHKVAGHSKGMAVNFVNRALAPSCKITLMLLLRVDCLAHVQFQRKPDIHLLGKVFARRVEGSPLRRTRTCVQVLKLYHMPSFMPSAIHTFVRTCIDISMRKGMGTSLSALRCWRTTPSRSFLRHCAERKRTGSPPWAPLYVL